MSEHWPTDIERSDFVESRPPNWLAKSTPSRAFERSSKRLPARDGVSLSLLTQPEASSSGMRPENARVDGTTHGTHRAEDKRKPRLLFRFPGSFLFRFADRQLSPSLFQLPPRFTRFEACEHSPALL